MRARPSWYYLVFIKIIFHVTSSRFLCIGRASLSKRMWSLTLIQMHANGKRFWNDVYTSSSHCSFDFRSPRLVYSDLKRNPGSFIWRAVVTVLRFLFGCVRPDETIVSSELCPAYWWRPRSLEVSLHGWRCGPCHGNQNINHHTHQILRGFVL